MENTTGAKTNYSALATLTTVFFFWGFIAAGNSVFIPFCKNYFHLDQFQSQLIDFASIWRITLEHYYFLSLAPTRVKISWVLGDTKKVLYTDYSFLH